jgi:hypothetical protein
MERSFMNLTPKQIEKLSECARRFDGILKEIHNTVEVARITAKVSGERKIEKTATEFAKHLEKEYGIGKRD